MTVMDRPVEGVAASAAARAASADAFSHGVPRLDPLTSLRFFAAAMIVAHHGVAWGIGPQWPGRFALAQGVSFFFILSGFVLAYNYPRLPDGPSVREFYVARIARIWPTHIATGILYLVLLSSVSYFTLPADWRLAITVAYVTLLHAWIPVWESVTAYNTVSWSISTEFFFYLFFPLLVANWSATWRRKLLLTFGIAVAMWLIADFAAPRSKAPEMMRGMLAYLHPLPRIFEFTLGIALCHWYRSHGTGLAKRFTVRAATAIELASVAAVVVGAWLSMQLATSQAVGRALSPTGALVLKTAGLGVLFYGFAIFVFAVGAGWISRLLRARPLVFLGEISFALYMVHTLFLLYRKQAPSLFADMPSGLVYVLYWVVGLALATAIHLGIERPCQTLIRGWHRGMPRSAFRRPATALAVFFAGAAAAILFQPSSRTPETGPAAAKANLLAAPASFGSAYRLESVELAREPGAPHPTLVLGWSADVDSTLAKRIGVHLLDAGGKLAGPPLDISMETGFRSARSGDRWSNRVPLGDANLGAVRSVAIAVYDQRRGLAKIAQPYAGASDWGGQRVVVKLDSIGTLGAVTPFALTDDNWVNGISRRHAGFFVASTPESARLLAIGRSVRFAEGTTRRVIDVRRHGPYVNVVLDGPRLDGAAVGHPNSVQVLE
jgi:peptidoglycan/LPS O-acetylase OafA/YrhL